MVGLLLICGSTFILVFLLIIFFCVRYHKSKINNRQIKFKESLLLEWGWTITSMVIFLGLFAWGTMIFFESHIAKKGATEIAVVGKQWMWKFQHKNGKREINELHIPVGQPIVLKMISQDVIHSLFVPSFRIKQDVLPGRYTKTWLEATKIGDYHLFCTQYCGAMHAQMLGRVYVLSAKDYDLWLENEADNEKSSKPESMADRGKNLFSKLSCISCHEAGKDQIGPSLVGILGSAVQLSTGQKIIADDNYIREKILYPNAKIVYGYPPVMPPFLGKISEEELHDLLAYIKTLGKNETKTSVATGE